MAKYTIPVLDKLETATVTNNGITLNFTKRSGIVSVDITGSLASAVGEWEVIAMVPEGFRPAHGVSFKLIFANDRFYRYHVIGTNGKFVPSGPMEANADLTGYICYVAA